MVQLDIYIPIMQESDTLDRLKSIITLGWGISLLSASLSNIFFIILCIAIVKEIYLLLIAIISSCTVKES